MLLYCAHVMYGAACEAAVYAQEVMTEWLGRRARSSREGAAATWELTSVPAQLPRFVLVAALSAAGDHGVHPGERAGRING